MAEETLLTCYNKGCGQKFSQENNNKDACQYHPGVPVFHDALKGWSCCKKRSTVFTEFLNFPGCSKGEHSNVKPVEPEKPKPAANVDEVVIETPKPQIIRKPDLTTRPSVDEPLQPLRVTVGASLKQALEKRLKELSLEQSNSTEANEGEVQIGTSCKNSACKKSYEGNHSNEEKCLFHPGVPIFHEGMKYWSCCRRKTSEFDNFLNQEGCEEGRHVWIKKEDPLKLTSCRFDWHQTPGAVTVSVFSKVANPEKTVIESNKVSLKVHITFDGDKCAFDKHFILKGVIDPQKSYVNMLGTKVEIVLKKAEPGAWSTLEMPSA